MDEQMKIREVADVVTQMLSDDKSRMDLYAKIDDAVNCVFEPDAAVKALPWVRNRHYALTDLADARDTGVRTFATLMPRVEIAPLNDEQAEYERTDMAEQAWQWEIERMNRIGTKSIHEQIMEDAMSYHAVALQTEYLPYKLKGAPKDNRIKALMRSRCFNWIRHHPGTVHYRQSDYGLESVAKVHPYSVQTLIDNFGRDNEGIQKILSKHPNAKPAELLKMQYVLIDYMDWENRVQFVTEKPMTSVPSVIGSSDIVFRNEKHGLPFIPWVIIDKGSPIWRAVLESGLWDNLQYMNLIRFAKAIEQSTRSTMVIKTPDGTLKNVWMDFTNPSNPIVTQLDGTVIDNIQPTPIDPQLEAIFQEMGAKNSSSTVSTVLRDASRFANTPFSSMNQMINLAMSQLSKAKNTAGDAEAGAIFQGFQWIHHSGIPFSAYRATSKDSKKDDSSYNGRGGQIIIDPRKAPTEKEIEKMSEKRLSLLDKTVYYDLDALYIKVELQSNNTTDEQTRLNVNINAIDKLGMSRQQAFERMGWDNYKLVSAQAAQEQLEQAELQKEIQLIMMQVEQKKMEMQMQMQQAQMQMEQQAQQQAMMQQQDLQNQQNAMMAQQAPAMQGMDMRSGMNPAAMQAPGMTREQITGQAVNGGQVQR
jgi:hypothetical protein